VAWITWARETQNRSYPLEHLNYAGGYGLQVLCMIGSAIMFAWSFVVYYLMHFSESERVKHGESRRALQAAEAEQRARAQSKAKLAAEADEEDPQHLRDVPLDDRGYGKVPQGAAVKVYDS